MEIHRCEPGVFDSSTDSRLGWLCRLTYVVVDKPDPVGRSEQSDLERGLIPLRIAQSALMLIVLFVAEAGQDFSSPSRMVFAAIAIVNVLFNIGRFVSEDPPQGRLVLLSQLLLDGMLGIVAVLALDPAVTPLAWIALLIPVLDAIALHSNVAGLLTWVAVAGGYTAFRALYPSFGGEPTASFSTGLQQLLAAALVGIPIGFWSTRLADALKRANEERRVARHTATRLRAAAQAGRRLVAARNPESVERELMNELISLGIDRAELWHENGPDGWRLNRAKGVPLREQTTVLLDKAASSGSLVSLDPNNAIELQQAHGTGLDMVVAIPFTKASDGILRIWSKTDRMLGEAEREAISVLAASTSTSFENARVHKALQDWSNELEHRANHDSLTGLLNRAGLFSVVTELTEAPVPPREIGVIFLDLDGFKAVNDTYGHEAGDKVLQVIANRFSAVMPENALLARMGGDEMAIVLTDPDELDTMETLATSLVEAACKPIRVSPHTAQVGASVGLTRGPGNASIDALMAEADTAMYDAKHAGGGAVAFSDR